MSVTEITATDPMRREINKGLMVAFINRNLTVRSNLDVRTAIVFYDTDGLFMYAVPALPAPHVVDGLDKVGIASWSKGIV